MRLSPNSTQNIAWGFIWSAGISAVVILLLIVVYVIARGLPVFGSEFFFTEPRGGISGEGGISSVFVSTIWLIATTMVILIPLGLGAAIYLSEYAPDNWLTRLIRYGVELLAGVPSIVFGLFGFAIFVLALNFSYSILAGALTLACLLLPFLIRSAEEAMRAVLPAAIPGIITGIILCVGGVVAESACLYVTMGGSAGMPSSFFDGGRSLAVHVFYLAMETNALDKALATGAVLIVLILIINLITRWLAWRFHARMEGKA